VLLRLGRLTDAVGDLEGAAAALPEEPRCLQELGVARLKSGLLGAALDAFDSCVERAPELADAHSLRAGVLLRLGRPEDALDAITRALNLRPDHDGDLNNRAVVLAALGRHGEAIRDYERSLEINGDARGTLNNLAWLLATDPDPALRDGPRAVGLATRALSGGKNGAWLDTLAAAYAEAGDFPAAVLTEEEAVEVSRGRNASFLRRLELYRSGRSYTQGRGQAPR